MSSTRLAARLTPPVRQKQILALLSGGICAFERCGQALLLPGTLADGPSIVGEVAHIRGEHPGSARYDPSMTDKARNAVVNLVYLCGVHCGLVDDQPNTYTVDVLLAMKARHESSVRTELSNALATVTFAEFDTVCEHLRAAPLTDGQPDFHVVSPEEKIERNELSGTSRFMIQMGLSQSHLVRRFVEAQGQIDSTYSDGLKAGFVLEYRRLRMDGLDSDSILDGLIVFASRGARAGHRFAAALAVVIYLFEACEIFGP